MTCSVLADLDLGARRGMPCLYYLHVRLPQHAIVKSRGALALLESRPFSLFRKGERQSAIGARSKSQTPQRRTPVCKPFLSRTYPMASRQEFGGVTYME